MRWTKRIGSLLLSAALVFSLAGCGGGNSGGSGGGSPSGETNGQKEKNGSGTNGSGTEKTALPLGAEVVAAQYPETAPYPREEDFILENGEMNYEGYDWAFQEWLQAQDDAVSVPEDAARIRPFFTDAVREFLGGTDENSACSPLNIYMALSMVAEVADGESRAQILDLLGADSMDGLRTQANLIWRALYTDDGTSTILPASSLWMREDIGYNAETLRQLAESYYASSFSGKMGSAELNKALQSWLNEQTRGLLEQQAGNVELTPDTVLAIAATLYYKAPWTSQFDESGTRKETFHAAAGDRDADFMHQTFDGIFCRGDGFTAVRMPLAEGGMWLLLPDEGTAPEDLLQNGAAMRFFTSPLENAQSENARIALSLPKFDVSFEQDLADGLKALGITDVFDPQKSDFTPLTTDADEIAVTKVQHAARVKIDEEGCEAAAFTVAMMEATAMMIEPQPVEFNLNRPFLFCVNAEGDLPLFVGAVQNPAEA